MSITIKLKNTVFTNDSLPKSIQINEDGFMADNLFAAYVMSRDGLDASNVGGESLINNGAVASANGFSFDGTSQYMTMPERPTETATYIIAFRSDKVAPSTEALLANASALGTGMRLSVGSTTDVRMWQYNDTGSNQPQPQAVTTSTVGTWLIAAVAVNFETKNVKVAISSKGIYTEDIHTDPLVDGNSTLTIGNPQGNGQFLEGEVACLLSYNSYLTDEEILFNSNAIKELLPSIPFA